MRRLEAVAKTIECLEVICTFQCRHTSPENQSSVDCKSPHVLSFCPVHCCRGGLT